MGGYRRQRTTFLLKFEEYPGLEIRTKSISLGTMFKLVDQMDSFKASSEMTKEALGDVQELLNVFTKSLVSWNLEDEDGVPIPCDGEHFLDEEISFVFHVLGAWSDLIGGEISAPLGKTSKDGSQLEVPPIKMETL